MTFVVMWPGGRRIIFAKNRYHLNKKLLRDRWIKNYFINNDCEIINITHKPVKKFEITYDYEDWSGKSMVSGHETQIVAGRHWFEAVNDFYERKSPQLAIPMGIKWKEVK